MGVNLEAIKKRVQELQSNRRNSNIQLWKPKEVGTYTVRAMPWPAKLTQDGQPFVERWFYYIGDNFGTLTPHQFGKPDPIKEFIDSLYASGTPDDREIAKKLRPKMQAYLPIIIKDGKGADPEKVLVWSINKFIEAKMLNWFLDEDIGDYLDPNLGFDIKVVVTDSGKKFNNKTVLNLDPELARKSTKLASTPEAIKKLLESTPNIDDMNELKSADELKSMLQKWLDGAPSGEGTDRGGSSNSGDALDELANEIRKDTSSSTSTPSDAKAEKPADDKKGKKKSKKDDETDEQPAPKQSLDEAFEELMADE